MVIASLRLEFGLRHLTLTPETTMTDERMALIELIEKGPMLISFATCSPLRPSA